MSNIHSPLSLLFRVNAVMDILHHSVSPSDIRCVHGGVMVVLVAMVAADVGHPSVASSEVSNFVLTSCKQSF